MTDNIMKLLGAGKKLDEATAKEIQAVMAEEMEKRVAEEVEKIRKEERDQMEAEIREETAAKYEVAREAMIEAADNLINDTLREELEGLHEDQKELVKKRDEYNKVLKNHTEKMRAFVVEQVSKEVNKVRKQSRINQQKIDEDRKKLMAAEAKYTREIEEHKKKMHAFVNKVLAEEVRSLRDQNRVKREKLAETQQFVQQELRKELEELHRDRARFAETVKKMQEFVMETLAAEVVELKTDREQMSMALEKTKGKARRMMQEEIAKFHARQQEREQHQDAQIADMQKFVQETIGEEMQELHEDRKSIATQKVKLIAESKSKMDAAKKKFVEQAAKNACDIVESTLRTELSQLKESIHEAQKNSFGRKIYEAFSSEFMSTGLAESTDTRKLADELQEAKVKANKARVVAKKAFEDKQLAESSLQRREIISELTSPLSKEQRRIMCAVLENVATDKLRKEFQRHLTDVIKETRALAAPSKPKSVNGTAPKSRQLTEQVASGDKTPVVTRDGDVKADSEVGEILEMVERIDRKGK